MGAKLKQFGFVNWLTLGAIILVGGFHTYIACLLSVAMCVYLVLRLKKGIVRYPGILGTGVLLLCLGYGLSCLWAVDPGMAFTGFLKFLSVGLYLLCLWQEEKTTELLEALPGFGAACVVLSALLAYAPLIGDYFRVAGRMAGFFQYPNTFAVFLLLCQLLSLRKAGKGWLDYVFLAILTGGILLTGSRTVFVLAVVADALMILFCSRKKGRVLLIYGGICLLVVLLALNEDFILHRYLTISLGESTFVGRVLYLVDALVLVLRYPFGMGYMGYYYIQGSIQTGVYSVTYAHNELLQLLLDVGWIPTIVFAIALGKWFFRKDVSSTDRILVGTLLAHCLFDFDLQFVGMVFLLLALMHRPGKPIRIKKTGWVRPLAGATAVVSLYMAVALGLAHLGAYRAADVLYPYNTANMLKMLSQTTDLEEANTLSDRILAQNQDYYAPYTMKAKYAYSQGDFTGVIQNKRKAFETNPFGWEEYEEYCQMLLRGIPLYAQMGDNSSAELCRQELINAQQRLRSNADRLSPLGKKIQDQPITELSPAVQAEIEKMN